jgi:hypothetical protein
VPTPRSPVLICTTLRLASSIIEAVFVLSNIFLFWTWFVQMSQIFDPFNLRTYAKHLKWHVISSESEVFVQDARKVGCLTPFDMTLRKS